ncbi:MAG TPA: FHA domain-containing protein [Pirellulales bacterium]|nr:FHA domain-containing protein [Pirellulales bacterium]
MRVALRVSGGRNAGQEISIRNRRFLIGRADDCQLRANSTQISRYHCAILVEEDGIWVRDYGSRNGTLVGETRVTERRQLANGDQLQVGPLRFEVVIENEPASAQETRHSPAGDTSMAGKLKTTLRAIERHDRPTDEGEILDIVSQPVERRVEPLPELTREGETDVAEPPPPEEPKTPPKPKPGRHAGPDPVDPADAAIDGLKRLFKPKK